MLERSRAFVRFFVALALGAFIATMAVAPASADPTASTTELTVSSSTPQYGSLLTLHAQITGAGVPSGDVTFFDGAAAIGTATLDSTASAQFSTSTLKVGSHSLTASYAGDANNAASASSAVIVTVLQRTRTDMLFYSVPKTPAVTWTPTTPIVLVANVIKATPLGTKLAVTGTVNFNVDGVVTTVPVTGLHHANLLFPNGLPLGTHLATAHYNGNASFTASTSVTRKVKVNRNLTTSISASPDPVVAGSTVTYTVTITNNGLAAATGVVASNTIPVDTTLISATAVGGCTGTTVVSCSLGNLPIHASRTATITVQAPSVPPAGGTIVDTATALLGSNNIATEETLVVAS
jgi:uncharacterized repeat protein (TIGR01451 family)